MNNNHNNSIALLTTIPKTITIPYFSSSCLFLETVLRVKNIPFETTQCSIWNVLPHEQFYPIIDVDNYCFRNVMEGIDYLLAKYKKSIDKGLLPIERAQAFAFSSLLDELSWMLSYSRAIDFTWLRDDRKIIEDFGKIHLYFWRNLIVPRLQKKTLRRVRAYGICGKKGANDVVVKTEAMLEALSAQLNSNKFFFNVKEASWLDCKAFAILAQFKYTPIYKEARIKQFMRERTPNLMTFVTRMKYEYWPDWQTVSD